MSHSQVRYEGYRMMPTGAEPGFPHLAVFQVNDSLKAPGESKCFVDLTER